MKHSDLRKSFYNSSVLFELIRSLSLSKGRKNEHSPFHAVLIAREEAAWKECFAIYPSTGSGTNNKVRHSIHNLASQSSKGSGTKNKLSRLIHKLTSYSSTGSGSNSNLLKYLKHTSAFKQPNCQPQMLVNFRQFFKLFCSHIFPKGATLICVNPFQNTSASSAFKILVK